jgi:hypothetical protein
MSRPLVVVVGAGFAGYHTARRLQRHLPDAELVLINPTDCFLVDLGGALAAANPSNVPISGLTTKTVTQGYHLELPAPRPRTASDWTLNTLLPPRAVHLGLVDAGRSRSSARPRLNSEAPRAPASPALWWPTRASASRHHPRVGRTPGLPLPRGQESPQAGSEGSAPAYHPSRLDEMSCR